MQRTRPLLFFTRVFILRTPEHQAVVKFCFFGFFCFQPRKERLCKSVFFSVSYSHTRLQEDYRRNTFFFQSIASLLFFAMLHSFLWKTRASRSDTHTKKTTSRK